MLQLQQLHKKQENVVEEVEEEVCPVWQKREDGADRLEELEEEVLEDTDTKSINLHYIIKI
jgi:hypothetical protein